jgi:hypothetical protein
LIAVNPPSVIDALERAPSIIVPLIREVPASRLRLRRAGSKWSAHEHMCHLAGVHSLFVERLDLMLENPAPLITPYDPGTDDSPNRLLELDLHRSIDDYVRDRATLVVRLRALEPEQWNITASHGEYSHYSVFIMFRHLALHDFLHAYRIEEILLQKGGTD